ncbi:prostate androgen-regulated mucin-like protein 1 isoform X2 [Pseudophryne corroboree]|uniref:prostate androgen-regulated mucin-like protein 1 isoform X2 n=1 Tax=Pseudophryne corroboree TaxID=495146 RepID=UPI00308210E4
MPGLNCESPVTESLQTTQTTLPISMSPHLESSQSLTTLELSNTVTSSVAVTETFKSKESLQTKTEGPFQSTLSGDNSATTAPDVNFNSTAMKNDSAVMNSTTESNERNMSTTAPNSLPTDSSIAPSTPTVVSGETLTTKIVELSSGPVESSTETTKNLATITENQTEITTKQTETTKNQTETTENQTESISNQTVAVTIATGNNPINSTSGEFSSTASTLVESGKTAGNTDPTTPVSKIDPSTNADESTESNKELHKALSTGSVAAITIIVIVLVLLIFGGAAFWKIRHSSYGRLLEDQDYGSLGNYNNPLYDDS